MKQKTTFNLLTIMGKVIPESIEATCKLHNETAGHPAGVAGAKALGDMSHMTYMPLDAATAFKGDLLFLDIWNSLDGMNKFFSDAQVLAGAGLMFASREPAVWSKLESFFNYQFPAPTGKNERVIGLVRGKVKSMADAEAIHNTANEPLVSTARAAGILSHDFYVRAAAPGSPEALEVLGVDVWMNADGMMKHYMSPEFQNSGLYNMFAAKPASSTWVHPKGDWVEW
ncbi:MAG TPA: hypothetical protein VK508_15495 [Cyclobacteriaceae bacterium]|nr:hypothetical protein [Cyclobacteriaceae bacterium]